MFVVNDLYFSRGYLHEGVTPAKHRVTSEQSDHESCQSDWWVFKYIGIVHDNPFVASADTFTGIYLMGMGIYRQYAANGICLVLCYPLLWAASH